MPDPAPLGQRLRVLRAASGRTVASVAADAGLSVPYIANLENGRGNPTLAALGRLTGALGASLDIRLVPPTEPTVEGTDELPASLVRLGRSQRFQRDTRRLAEAQGTDHRQLSGQLIAALAAISSALGTDPGEIGWHRLLDALLLIVLHPVVRA